MPRKSAVFTKTFAGCLGLSALAMTAQAEVSTEIGLYGYGVAIGGNVELGNVDMDIDLSTSDVLDALNGAFLGYVEHQRDDWLFLFRVEYMDLRFDGETSRGPISVDTDAKMTQLTPQAFVGYRSYDAMRGADRLTADVFAGIRHIDIDLDVDASVRVFGADVNRGFEQGISFTEPVLAARAKYTWSNAWGLAGWVDLGGFGIGSDLSYTAEVTVDRQFDNGWRVFGGWKYFAFEYTDDTRYGDLTFKPTYQGPVLGASYRF